MFGERYFSNRWFAGLFWGHRPRSEPGEAGVPRVLQAAARESAWRAQGRGASWQAPVRGTIWRAEEEGR
jgi:hypothetical protein